MSPGGRAPDATVNTRGVAPSFAVIVCGANMGDIFRRNSLNLGLHVVQAPDAVADAQDGDRFAFEPPRLSDLYREALTT